MPLWFIPDNVHVGHGASTELFTPGWVIPRSTPSDMCHSTENAGGIGSGITPSAHDPPDHQHARLRSALGWIASHLSRMFLEEDIRLSHVFRHSPQKKDPMSSTALASDAPESNGISCPEYVRSKQDFLLQGVLRSLTEHIAVLDADGTIIAVNEAWDRFAQENGATDLRHTSVGVNYLQVCQRAVGPFSEGVPEVSAGIKAVLQHFSSYFTLEYSCPSPDKERWFLMYVMPLSDDHGGAVVVHMDITERRRAEQQRRLLERKLMEAQKLESLGMLAGGIAHDFNNLLVSILGSAELALLDLASDTPAHAHVKHIELATHRAAELTRQILIFAGKRQLVAQLVDLNAVVAEMCNLLTASVARYVDLQTNFYPHLPMIEVDAIQIRQVIMNLVINSVEALSQADGCITITTGFRHVDQAYLATTHLVTEARVGNYVYLEVADTGQGMDSTTLGRIFDPFFTTKETGHGLGLAAVLDIVREHKGTVNVVSTVGQGTTFTVLVPCYSPSPQCGAGEEVALTAAEINGTILVIDDEKNVRTVIQRMLKQFGFTVMVADDRRTGLDLFRAQAETIDCVLINLTLPHLDGTQLLPEIRCIRPDASVVLISGSTEVEIAQCLTTEKLPTMLIKPFTARELCEKIYQAIAQCI